MKKLVFASAMALAGVSLVSAPMLRAQAPDIRERSRLMILPNITPIRCSLRRPIRRPKQRPERAFSLPTPKALSRTQSSTA